WSCFLRPFVLPHTLHPQAIISRVSLRKALAIAAAAERPLPCPYQDDPPTKQGGMTESSRPAAITRPSLAEIDEANPAVRASEIRALLQSALSTMEVSDLVNASNLFDPSQSIERLTRPLTPPSRRPISDPEIEATSGLLDMSDLLLDGSDVLV